jgi:hypothetical protein
MVNGAAQPVDRLIRLLIEMHWVMHNKNDMEGYRECHKLLHQVFEIAPRSHTGKLRALLLEAKEKSCQT